MTTYLTMNINDILSVRYFPINMWHFNVESLT